MPRVSVPPDPMALVGTSVTLTFAAAVASWFVPIVAIALFAVAVACMISAGVVARGTLR